MTYSFWQLLCIQHGLVYFPTRPHWYLLRSILPVRSVFKVLSFSLSAQKVSQSCLAWTQPTLINYHLFPARKVRIFFFSRFVIGKKFPPTRWTPTKTNLTPPTNTKALLPTSSVCLSVGRSKTGSSIPPQPWTKECYKTAVGPSSTDCNVEEELVFMIQTPPCHRNITIMEKKNCAKERLLVKSSSRLNWFSATIKEGHLLYNKRLDFDKIITNS